jgi:hypothetical protein
MVPDSRLATRLEDLMNAFLQHHKHSIKFHYRCFDRILINAAIQTFQEPVRAVYFFRDFRQTEPVSRDVLRDIADQYQNWVTNRALHWQAPILDEPEDRRDEFMESYFIDARPDQIVGIIKAREPARILVSIGKKNGPCHLEFKRRWVNQFNFYVNDSHFGRMFVRVCPYFPFAARIYINQHSWLANRMREEGIRFRQCANAFLSCSDPKRLQQLADFLLPDDLIACGQKWLACLAPFFTAKERASTACSFPRSNIPTIWSSAAVQPWTPYPNGCSMPTAPSGNRIRSASFSAAASPNASAAPSRP